jgi:Protein of unknown function (DUF3467)
MLGFKMRRASPRSHENFCYSGRDFREGSMAEAPKPQQVQIKADEKELVGQYSNLVMIHHNAEEFTLNFIYIFPSVPQGKLVSSVIVSPGHAKRLMRALSENITRYEAQFGPIPEGPGPTPEPTVGFVQ